MKFILGKKIEMSQRYGKDGKIIPVTLVEAGPCVVTQQKSIDVDGYKSVQIGFGKAKKINKPMKNHLKDLDSFKVLREFRLPDDLNFERGAKIDASVFEPGDRVQVTGLSKGHGFQGVVKRHHFSGSPASHGHKDQLRMPGSIGSKRQGPVQRGKKMAGRMGDEQVTIKNLEIVGVEAKNNILAIKGAVPGGRGSLLLISTVS